MLALKEILLISTLLFSFAFSIPTPMLDVLENYRIGPDNIYTEIKREPILPRQPLGSQPNVVAKREPAKDIVFHAVKSPDVRKFNWCLDGRRTLGVSTGESTAKFLRKAKNQKDEENIDRRSTLSWESNITVRVGLSSNRNRKGLRMHPFRKRGMFPEVQRGVEAILRSPSHVWVGLVYAGVMEDFFKPSLARFLKLRVLASPGWGQKSQTICLD